MSTLRAARTTWSVFDPAYSILAGSHRIQRVPDTEKNGRRHSSDVTVVVFDADTREPSTAVRRDDVREDTFRGSGAGGQHRNKTDSCVRLTHLPTKISVVATEQRSQHQNRSVAWKRLEQRLAEASIQEQHHKINIQRQDMIETSRSWTWCGWRDEVKGPDGLRTSMKRALSGRLDSLVK